MIEKRRSRAKAALGRQEAELRRTAPGKRFIGEDTGAAQARALEREKVHRMQAAAREAALREEQERQEERAHEALVRRPLWEGAAGLVLESARLAATLAVLPLRAARLPFRMAAALLPRPRHA